MKVIKEIIDWIKYVPQWENLGGLVLVGFSFGIGFWAAKSLLEINIF